jgi:D-glycero-alpha-D-manno-heptose-7-phosphate kinase
MESSHVTMIGSGVSAQTTGAHYNAPVQVDSSAPTRLDLGGGTLDIWPLYLFHPGAQTVNVAVRLRAACQVTATSDGSVSVRSDDTGHTLTAPRWQALDTTGENRLLAHIARFFQIDGIRITTRAASPMGAGIAGSSALTIAVCAALARWRGNHYSPDQLLTLAMNLEARTLGIPTGVQDYRPALYGGVSAVELDPLGVTRVLIEVDTAELERRLVLVYSGDSRSSGLNNWDITRRHIEGDGALAAEFGHIRDIATAIRDALTRGDWTELATQVNREWQARQALAPGVTTPTIETLMASARSAGAEAGKVCGAGGGGCIFFLIDPDRRAEVCHALTDAGARLLECSIDTDGLLVESHDA